MTLLGTINECKSHYWWKTSFECFVCVGFTPKYLVQPALLTGWTATKTEKKYCVYCLNSKISVIKPYKLLFYLHCRVVLIFEGEKYWSLTLSSCSIKWKKNMSPFEEVLEVAQWGWSFGSMGTAAYAYGHAGCPAVPVLVLSTVLPRTQLSTVFKKIWTCSPSQCDAVHQLSSNLLLN